LEHGIADRDDDLALSCRQLRNGIGVVQVDHHDSTNRGWCQCILGDLTTRAALKTCP
jgi:hypothetical protein